ncbi:MAG TPA: Ig-like domain-containing protein [Candidatus Eisenbacteria bacterium]|jgi:uncharacterized protein (DUF2141 family)
MKRAAATSALLLATLMAGSCGKKGPPSGGPPDLEPPRLIASTPDSGVARVARDVRPTLTFSEGMEPRSTGDAIALAPRVDIGQQRWRGHTVTLVLAESLRADQTYTVFVGNGARDRHGNALARSASVVFSTADSLPAGILEGEIDARGFKPAGTYLWCYDAARGHEPDSTARDFDALGLVDDDGRFRVVGLPVPGRYRLWAFVDLNGNRSFEPASDILAPTDSAIALSREQPVGSGLKLLVVNPHAPGRVRGTVLDSLHVSQGRLRILAVAQGDSTQKQAFEVNERSEFDIELAAGKWQLRAYRDIDGNRAWERAHEPASDPPSPVVLQPAVDLQNLVLVLKWLPPP